MYTRINSVPPCTHMYTQKVLMHTQQTAQIDPATAQTVVEFVNETKKIVKARHCEFCIRILAFLESTLGCPQPHGNTWPSHHCITRFTSCSPYKPVLTNLLACVSAAISVICMQIEILKDTTF